MRPPFQVKQGCVLLIAFTLAQDDGTPVNLTGAVLYSEIRDGLNNLLCAPVLTVTNAAAGQFTYSAASSTSWPVGRVRSDLFLEIGGTPFFSDTFRIQVEAPVTNAAAAP